MKRFILLRIALSVVAPLHAQPATTDIPSAANPNAPRSGDRILARAFKLKTSGFMVKFRGTIIAKLPDDTDGSRHQRCIVRLSSGQTLLIAHNIDLAPRVRKPRSRHEVVIQGEYIWNSEGGIIHKTHLDPDGGDPDGWIRHEGRIYQ